MKHNEEELEAIAQLLEKAKGNRTIREYASDAGTLPSNICKYLKRQAKISPESIRKLTSQSAKPQNGVTCEDLMIAAGYQTDYVQDTYNNLAATFLQNNTGATNTELKDFVQQSKKANKQFKTIAKGIIISTLAGNGYETVQEIIKSRDYKFMAPDMKVKTKNTQWLFNIHSCSDDMIGSDIRQVIAEQMFIKPDPQRKISIVIDNADIYDKMISYQNELSYLGDLSVILINTTDMNVVNECYLSYYNNDRKNEFYIHKSN